jgi:hypothetical protein
MCQLGAHHQCRPPPAPPTPPSAVRRRRRRRFARTLQSNPLTVYSSSASAAAAKTATARVLRARREEQLRRDACRVLFVFRGVCAIECVSQRRQHEDSTINAHKTLLSRLRPQQQKARTPADGC